MLTLLKLFWKTCKILANRTTWKMLWAVYVAALRDQLKVNMQVVHLPNEEKPMEIASKVASADRFFTDAKFETDLVHTIVCGYLEIVCAALGLDPNELPTIVVIPYTHVWGGLEDAPDSVVVKWDEERKPSLVQIAGVRIHGTTMLDFGDDDKVWGYFEPGSELYERCVVHDLAVALTHIAHDDADTPNLAWEDARAKAHMMAHAIVEEIFGPLEGWTHATLAESREARVLN